MNPWLFIFRNRRLENEMIMIRWWTGKSVRSTTFKVQWNSTQVNSISETRGFIDTNKRHPNPRRKTEKEWTAGRWSKRSATSLFGGMWTPAQEDTSRPTGRPLLKRMYESSKLLALLFGMSGIPMMCIYLVDCKDLLTGFKLFPSTVSTYSLLLYLRTVCILLTKSIAVDRSMHSEL